MRRWLLIFLLAQGIIAPVMMFGLPDAPTESGPSTPGIDSLLRGDGSSVLPIDCDNRLHEKILDDQNQLIEVAGTTVPGSELPTPTACK